LFAFKISKSHRAAPAAAALAVGFCAGAFAAGLAAAALAVGFCAGAFAAGLAAGAFAAGLAAGAADGFGAANGFSLGSISNDFINAFIAGKFAEAICVDIDFIST
jgi:hypothetical protein